MGAALEGYTITSFAFEDMDIDVFGDTAVVHSRYSQIALVLHVNLSNVFRLTDVWSRGTGTVAGRRAPLVDPRLTRRRAARDAGELLLRVVVEPAPALAAEQARLDHPVQQRRRDRGGIAELVVERLARPRAACRARSGRTAPAAPSGARSPCTMPSSMSSLDAKPDSYIRIADSRYGISSALTTKPGAVLGVDADCLPSVSSANAPRALERLVAGHDRAHDLDQRQHRHRVEEVQAEHALGLATSPRRAS